MLELTRKRGAADAVREIVRSAPCDVASLPDTRLAAIWDEDRIDHPGRCAVRRRALAGAAIAALGEFGSPRAVRPARRLQGRVSAGS